MFVCIFLPITAKSYSDYGGCPVKSYATLKAKETINKLIKNVGKQIILNDIGQPIEQG